MIPLEVFPVGTLVKIGDFESNSNYIIGKVTQICISKSDWVEYEIAWWNGRERKKEWFREFEVKWHQGDRQKIGFKDDQKKTH